MEEGPERLPAALARTTDGRRCARTPRQLLALAVFFFEAAPSELPELLDLGLASESSPTAARLASSAAIRSGAAAGSSACGWIAISSPAAFRSIRSSTRSRYSSWYF